VVFRIGDGGLEQFIAATHFVLHHSGSTSEPDAFLIDILPTRLDLECSTLM